MTSCLKITSLRVPYNNNCDPMSGRTLGNYAWFRRSVPTLGTCTRYLHSIPPLGTYARFRHSYLRSFPDTRLFCSRRLNITIFCCLISSAATLLLVFVSGKTSYFSTLIHLKRTAAHLFVMWCFFRPFRKELSAEVA